MNCNPCHDPCAQPCPCEPPRANVPPVVVILEGGAPVQVDIPLFGTPPFSASIAQNPQLPSGPDLIFSATVLGHTLRVITSPAQAIDGIASYTAVIRVRNQCGCFDIPVTVQVVEELPPPPLSCSVIGSFFPYASRPLQTGDRILIRDGASCATVDLPPPPSVDLCPALLALVPTSPANIVQTLVPYTEGSQCASIPAPELVCRAIQAFPTQVPELNNAFIPYWFNTDSEPQCAVMEIPSICGLCAPTCDTIVGLFPEAGRDFAPGDRVLGTDSGGFCQLFDVPPSASGGSMVFAWGARQVNTAPSIIEIPFGWSDVTVVSGFSRHIYAPRAGTLRNFYLRQENAGAGNANIINYSIAVNGGPTLLQFAVPANSFALFTDLVNTVAVNAGDTISLRAEWLADIGDGELGLVASVEFA